MKIWVLGASALALSIGAQAAFADDHADSVTLYRVFVADHAEAKVKAFDLDKPDNRWVFTTDGQSKLFAVDDGAAIVAVQSDSDAVHFISTGIALNAHGDHADIEIAEPQAVAHKLAGPRPFHVIDHHGKAIVNFDKGGYAEIIDTHALTHGALETSRLEQERAHHGFAAPVGDHWVTTVATDTPVAGTRIGLQAVAADGAPIGDVATCTGIHGEAFSGAYLAAGCKEGVLTVTAGEDGPVFQMLPYPADLPGDQMTGTLLGARSMQAFLGNYGADGLVVIDPVDEPHFHYIELPFRRIDFALDPADFRFGYVLTEDGSLHRIDILKGSLVENARITAPYSMDGHWNDPRPRMAMAGDEIVVSDPNAGVVRRIAKDSLQETGVIAVGGMPYNVAVAGGSGVVHEGEHTHDHGNTQIYKGYFEDSQIADRPLSDWAGDWQSVYPYLQDGTLDPVMQHKAETGDMTAEEYKDYYDTGYRTDVERITIEGDIITFYDKGEAIKARYESDGYEVLTYPKGNRGVRFIFRKADGDEAAPQFIQFSDHGIAPARADHYHLYWGDDRAALLQELTNWPTYYPSALNASQIVSEMLAH